jgi:hypothetical protein
VADQGRGVPPAAILRGGNRICDVRLLGNAVSCLGHCRRLRRAPARHTPQKRNKRRKNNRADKLHLTFQAAKQGFLFERLFLSPAWMLDSRRAKRSRKRSKYHTTNPNTTKEMQKMPTLGIAPRIFSSHTNTSETCTTAKRAFCLEAIFYVL